MRRYYEMQNDIKAIEGYLTEIAQLNQTRFKNGSCSIYAMTYTTDCKFSKYRFSMNQPIFRCSTGLEA